MANYIWTRINRFTADKMNTSFGTRIDRNRQDFQDGIDLPAAISQGGAEIRILAYWPSTVFTADAAWDIVQYFHADTLLQDILSKSKVWASEGARLPHTCFSIGLQRGCQFTNVQTRWLLSVPIHGDTFASGRTHATTISFLIFKRVRDGLLHRHSAALFHRFFKCRFS